MTIAGDARAVTSGAGTHADTHVAAALDPVGGLLGAGSSPRPGPATPACSAGWAGSGPSPWSASRGPAATVRAWPATSLRPASGSSKWTAVTGRTAAGRASPGPLDAVSAARAAQSGRARGAPKGRNGAVEAIRALTGDGRSARSERTQTSGQARSLIVTGPGDLRARFTGHTVAALVSELAALRPRPGDAVGYATRIALRELGRRAEFPGG
jgi:transposase